MRPDYFVTGTDTGVGKTFASVALLHRLRAGGLRAVGMKPVASGCERTEAGWRNEDALRLQAASDPHPAYADLNPYPLPLPTAPQLAAEAAGVRIDSDRLIEAYRALASQADVVVVEGVGGWAAPFDHDLEQADLARALALPVVLVVGVRLGCLSHARLTARAIAADGVSLVGWVANTIDPAFTDTDAYLGLLADALDAPCLGTLPFLESWDAAAMANALRLPVGIFDPCVKDGIAHGGARDARSQA
jgi:dethiobiotin synthetase